MHALRKCLAHQLQNVGHGISRNIALNIPQGTASQNFICHGVQLSARVLTQSNMARTALVGEVGLTTAAGLVNCLLDFLKGLSGPLIANTAYSPCPPEPTSADLSRSYVSDASTFVDRLQSCIVSALSYERSAMSEELACNCFAALLEASLHCPNVWESFKTADGCATLLQQLLLEDPREGIRQGIAARLEGICAALAT